VPKNGAMLLLESLFLIRKKRLWFESGILVFCCVFEGCFEKVGGWRWFFDGENVVNGW
jgi:hypothetical protein